MTEETLFDAYVERFANGVYRAFAVDLPGCMARNEQQSAALEAAIAAIPGYFEWLRQHDEYTPVIQGPFHLNVVAGADVPADHHTAFFPRDRETMAPDDLEWRLTILEWLYDDLTGRATTISRPDLVYELVASQWWLAGRLKPEASVTKPFDGGPAEQLRAVRNASLAQLRSVYAADPGRVTDRDGELWSLRTVVRCSIFAARDALDALGA